MKEDLNVLLDLKVPAVNIAKYIRETSNHLLTTKDIHNIRTASRSLDTEEDKVLSILEEYLANDNLVRVFVNEKDEIEAIHIQDKEMQGLVESYPEVMFLDTTHNINRSHLKLTTIMIIDRNGNGQPVAQAFLTRERKESLVNFMEVFKEANPSTEGTSVFIIDKDFNEFDVISDLWPTSRIFFCLFHLLQTFGRKIHKLHCGNKKKEILRELCQKLAYAQSEQDFKKYYLKLEATNVPEFMSYFDNNWMNIREKWTLYERNKVRTFGHKTTNVIESYHQKVKKNLHANISFSDCLKEVLSWNSNKHLQLHPELPVLREFHSCA